MQTMFVKSGNAYRQATEAEVAEVAGFYAREAFNRERPVIETPTTAIEYLIGMYAGRDYESFCVLYLTSHRQIITCLELFRGTINTSSVHAREVVKEALWRSAACVILAHNHPSGSIEPSTADIRITHRLVKALELIDVQVLDHLIIGGTGQWRSLSQSGLMP